MKTTWYYNFGKFNQRPKKVTKKFLIEQFGKEKVDWMYRDALETYKKDPNISLGWGNGVSVEFKL